MPPEANDDRQPPQWSGLDEYLDSDAFREAMADEFPEDAAEWTDPVTRRGFLSLMGASLALAGAAGCSPRPASGRKILPYTSQPLNMTPGVPLFFATAAPLAGYGAGVLVRSHEGRPVKVEGNPDHPSSLGGTSVFTQASVLDLYDPDRSRRPLHKGNPVSYEAAVDAVRKRLEGLKAKGGAGLRILSETVTSPTLADQLDALLKDYPEARWVQYDAVGRDNVREGTRKAFGKAVNVTYDFTKADVVLSLDADFLTVGPGQTRYGRDFAARRKVRQNKADGGTPEQMSRVYAVECMPGLVGTQADHRLPLLASHVESFARAVAAELKVGGAPAAGTLPDAAKAWVGPLAADLRAHTGKVIVIAGDHQPASLHALALAINSSLGSVGENLPVRVWAPVEARPDGKVIDLPTLVDQMAKKQVDTLLLLGGNPAYTAPVDVPFAEALKNVPVKVHVGLYDADETASLCDYHVPTTHYLEAWGDVRGHDGTTTILQPLIAPLYAAKSLHEFLVDLGGAGAREGREVVRAYWKRRFTADGRSGEFEDFWQESVRKGVVADSAAKPEAATLAGDWSANAPPPPAAPADFEVNFRPDPTLYDGRFANNGWLQELPKPVSKLTWDNAAFVSPKTAKDLNLKKWFAWTAGERGRVEVSVVELEFRGRKVKAPIWALPGHPDNAVTVHLGSGREKAGRVGNVESEPNAEGKPVRGFNAFALRDSKSPWFAGGLKVTATPDEYYLACVQGNWSMVEKDPISGTPLDRRPARRGTLDQLKSDPKFAKVPPASPGETELIDLNVPAPGDRSHGLPNKGTGVAPDNKPHDHSNKDATRHGADQEKHEGHDHRLTPLTMYNPNETLYPKLDEQQRRRWGMAIDLQACIGCNACVVACQSENNIPVVGKKEVTRGHEMHWIRIDRYYSGDPATGADLDTHFQPVACVQCEKAPCEIVCPVGATVHSADGLNDMVYNRCVGTRYCSNNCPYKVRRFNFLTFQDWATDTIKLGRNPDVSVRSRGVMEKCTYCVQRIRGAEIVAEREYARGERKDLKIMDGEVVTACQSACPTAAIVFGDLNDTASTVNRWKSEPTNYGLLAELNTMPRTSYLASLRNPNPAMPGKG